MASNPISRLAEAIAIDRQQKLAIVKCKLDALELKKDSRVAVKVTPSTAATLTSGGAMETIANQSLSAKVGSFVHGDSTWKDMYLHLRPKSIFNAKSVFNVQSRKQVLSASSSRVTQHEGSLTPSEDKGGPDSEVELAQMLAEQDAKIALHDLERGRQPRIATARPCPALVQLKGHLNHSKAASRNLVGSCTLGPHASSYPTSDLTQPATPSLAAVTYPHSVNSTVKIASTPSAADGVQSAAHTVKGVGVDKAKRTLYVLPQRTLCVQPRPSSP